MKRITITQLNPKNILSVNSLCITKTFLLPSVLNRTDEAYEILASDSNHKTVSKTLELDNHVTSHTVGINSL